MTDLLEAAQKVKIAVEAAEAERYSRLTQNELASLPTYQFSVPTGPKPGFRYKRMHWRIPGETRWWRGQDEAHVRQAMSRPYYKGPLESFWIVYICEQDPENSKYVLHKPREVKVIP